MKHMRDQLFRFYADDTAAVTVDWVVLTAAIVGIGITVILPIAYTTDNSASAVASIVMAAPVGYSSVTP